MRRIRFETVLQRLSSMDSQVFLVGWQHLCDWIRQAVSTLRQRASLASKLTTVPPLPSLLLAACLFSPLPAHANIFDPLLRILIPNYQSDEQSQQPEDESTSEQAEQSNEQTNDVQQNQDNSALDAAPSNSVSDNSASNLSEINESEMNDELQGSNLEVEVEVEVDVDADSDADSDSVSLNQTQSALRQSEPELYALLDAEFAASRGQIDKALDIYKTESFKNEATAVFERALTLSLAHEDAETSLRFARAWQYQNPDHVPAWFYVTHLALKAHDYQLAGRTLNRILRYDPRADLSQILIGIYPDNESDQRELLATLQQLNSEHNPSLSVLEAGLLLQFNETLAALMHIDRALEAQPDNVPFITLKADILKQMESPDFVLNYLKLQRERLPANKSLYLYEIRYRIEQEQTQSAWSLLLEAHNAFPNDAEITLLAALVSLDIQKYDTADRLLYKLTNAPIYVDQAYYYLGISAERQHNYEQAQRYLNSVMQADLVLPARKKVVAFQLMDNNVDGAMYTLSQLKEDFPEYSADAFILQADILRQKGNLETAQDLLAFAGRKLPNNEAIMFARAQLLDNQQDFIIKRTLLRQLLTLQPNDLSYQLGYAELLLANNPNSSEGLQIATNVVNIDYSNPSFDAALHIQALNALATNALANQRYQEVVNYLQTPYEVLPTLPSGILLLRAYQGLGADDQVNTLLTDLQQRFSFGQQNINDSVQIY